MFVIIVHGQCNIEQQLAAQHRSLVIDCTPLGGCYGSSCFLRLFLAFVAPVVVVVVARAIKNTGHVDTFFLPICTMHPPH